MWQVAAKVLMRAAGGVGVAAAEAARVAAAEQLAEAEKVA